MFEINNREVKTYTVDSYEFSVIEDFYKYPDQIVKWITSFEPVWHKHMGGYFHQGVDFLDKRHHLYNWELEPVYRFLQTITHQVVEEDSLYFHGDEQPNEYFKVSTNYTKFLNNKYNNHYFFPHKDLGKTCICYLNKNKSNGTNFYKPNYYQMGVEHKQHYIPKSEMEVLHHIHSEYNKLIIWDGQELYHGLCMDKKYTKEWRLNQVFFFQP